MTGNPEVMPPDWSRQTIDPYRDCPKQKCGDAQVRVVGAVSIGSFEVSRWRLRRMRCAMGIESILVLKALLDGGVAKTPVIDAHHISRTHLRHPTSGASG